jgi:hypothetical protein
MPTAALSAPSTIALLVVVHPGSLCGSFWFNGGTQVVLDDLLAEIEGWQGTTVGVANDLHDELDNDEEVAGAYRPIVAQEFEADGFENEFRRAAAEIVAAYPVAHLSEIRLTGAWVGKDGCVTCLAQALTKRVKGRVPVVISEFAARE